MFSLIKQKATSAQLLDRYYNQIALDGFDMDKQLQLKASRVLVIGAGSLGLPVCMHLNSMGVGTIGVLDQETISYAHLYKHSLFGTEDVGKPKLNTIVERLSGLNSDVRFQVHDGFLHSENIVSILENYDLMIDCTDALYTHYLVNDACVITRKPFIIGRILGEEGQVSVLNFKGSATFRCLFDEPTQIPSSGNRGMLGVLPGIVGTLMANEAVKVLTQYGEPLINQLLNFNIRENIFQTFNFLPNPENLKIQELQSNYGPQIIPHPPYHYISVQELKEWFDQIKDFSLIDVREKEEWKICQIDGSIHIPMSRLEASLDNLDKDKTLVFLCHHGMRSKAIASNLVRKGYEKVYIVTGGIHAWAREMDSSMEIY